MRVATTVALVSDLHCNSTVALCPPVVNRDDGGTYRASAAQRWIWRQWESYWGMVAEMREKAGGGLVVILNGELADDNYHGKFQLVDVNPKTQMATAIGALEPMTAILRPEDRIYVTRGTEAHSGRSAWMDDAIGADLGAVSPSEGVHSFWHLRLSVEGVRFDVAHHPPVGPGRVLWTRQLFATRMAAVAYFEALQAGERPPDLFVRGHFHAPGDSYDAHPVRALALPSWQLTTAFGYRIGGGRPYPVGGAVVTCDRGQYEVVKRFTKWPMGGYEVLDAG